MNAINITADACNPCIGAKKVQNKESSNPIVKNELKYLRIERVFSVFSGVL